MSIKVHNGFCGFVRKFRFAVELAGKSVLAHQLWRPCRDRKPCEHTKWAKRVMLPVQQKHECAQYDIVYSSSCGLAQETCSRTIPVTLEFQLRSPTLIIHSGCTVTLSCSIQAVVSIVFKAAEFISALDLIEICLIYIYTARDIGKSDKLFGVTSTFVHPGPRELGEQQSILPPKVLSLLTIICTELIYF